MPTAVLARAWSVQIGLLLLAALTAAQLVATLEVDGRSMEPQLQPGDRVLVDLWTYTQRAPRPNEVVWIAGTAPLEAGLIKRAASAPTGRTPVPAAGPSVWVLGDNPAESLDSRAFGAVPLTRVRGRVVLRYWPPSRSGWIR